MEVIMEIVNGKRISYKDIVINELILKDGSNCKICGKKILERPDIEIDHIIPLRLQGKNLLNNLQLVHMPCHRLKDRQIRSENPIAYKKFKKNGNTLGRKTHINEFQKAMYKQMRDKIFALYSEGMNKTNIAKKLNISRPTLYDILNRNIE
jgi:Mor family transcriptional regulator